KGAQMLGFRTLPEALVNLARLLENHSVRAYVHFYFDKIDAVCHSYGPEAPQTGAEIESFLLLMEHFFGRLFDPGKRVLFLMTADHGASEVDPKTTIYLNTDPRFAGLDRFFRRNARGELLVPAGSPRDMFLYIRSELLDEAQAFLSARLHGRAEVVKVSELIDQGYFGPEVSPEFQQRVGNLVILPYLGESVWWFVRHRFEQRYYGQHGGLTPEEMDIALFTCELNT
ncbi:MAG: alkaline phosphatase family protein, partial [Bacteroidota bacterium]